MASTWPPASAQDAVDIVCEPTFSSQLVLELLHDCITQSHLQFDASVCH